MNIILTEEERALLQNIYYELALYEWIPSIELEDDKFVQDETSFEFQLFKKIGMIGETK